MEREIVLWWKNWIKEHSDKGIEQINCGLQTADLKERENVELGKNSRNDKYEKKT
jgi:hypothetical protein